MTEAAIKMAKKKTAPTEQAKPVDLQKQMCNALIKNANEINGVKYAEIPLAMLSINDEVQRRLKGQEKKIAASWDRKKCGAITVSFRDDKFFIIDGHHRAVAAKAVGEQTITCQIYEGLKVSDEARIFGTQMENVVRLTTGELYRAMLLAKDKSAVRLGKLCDKYGVNVAPVDNDRRPILRGLRAAQISLRVYGEECLIFAFETIRKANWHNETGAYGETMLLALRAMYANHKDDLTRTQQAIVAYLSKTNFNSLTAQAKVSFLGRGSVGAVIALLEKAVG